MVSLLCPQYVRKKHYFVKVWPSPASHPSWQPIPVNQSDMKKTWLLLVGLAQVPPEHMAKPNFFRQCCVRGFTITIAASRGGGNGGGMILTYNEKKIDPLNASSAICSDCYLETLHALDRSSGGFGAPAWMKPITTSPLERYDISTFGLRAPPRAPGARQSYYDSRRVL
jgi:hypothetical protein